jgi:hypothetical protein
VDFGTPRDAAIDRLTLPTEAGEEGGLAPSAIAWPEADALFHTNPDWVGADDARGGP